MNRSCCSRPDFLSFKTIPARDERKEYSSGNGQSGKSMAGLTKAVFSFLPLLFSGEHIPNFHSFESISFPALSISFSFISFLSSPATLFFIASSPTPNTATFSTMAPAVPPEITYDVNNIHTALNYTVPDQEALVNIVGRREYQQLLSVARHYRACHGVDLASELDRRIIGSVGSLLAGACQHKVLAEVQYLHRAGKSNRKYETLRKKDTAIEVFCEILVGRTPVELRELREAYTTVHKGEDMLQHILGFCKDDITKTFFTEIVKDKEDKPLESVDAAIENMHKLLESRDLEGLLKYASSLTTTQLRTLVRSYNAKYIDSHVVTTVQKTIAHKHKDEHVELLLFVVMQAADPARHVSLLMEESMAGLGTNEDQLSRLVVLNRGKFMEKVKAAYQVDYSRTLADRVRGDTSGLYSHLICHLINQTI